MFIDSRFMEMSRYLLDKETIMVAMLVRYLFKSTALFLYFNTRRAENHQPIVKSPEQKLQFPILNPVLPINL